MTLSFPNQSRSYDGRRRLVRFWGQDNTSEISFLVEVSALRRLVPHTARLEDEYLHAFDSARDRIHQAACKVYSRARTGPYLLMVADFCGSPDVLKNGRTGMVTRSEV